MLAGCFSATSLNAFWASSNLYMPYSSRPRSSTSLTRTMSLMRAAESVAGYFESTDLYLAYGSSVLPAAARTSPCFTIALALSSSVAAVSSALENASSASSYLPSFMRAQPSPSWSPYKFFESGHVSKVSLYTDTASAKRPHAEYASAIAAKPSRAPTASGASRTSPRTIAVPSSTVFVLERSFFPRA